MSSKKMKNIIVIVFCAIFGFTLLTNVIPLIIFLVKANSTPSGSTTSTVTQSTVSEYVYEDFEPSKYNLDYYLNSYDVDITVDENRVFYVTETIEAFYNIPKHGIIRKIPFKGKLYRADNSSDAFNAKISDISVNATYEVSNASGYKSIKIGDANRTLTGSHTYVIEYTYDMGNDPLKNMDEFYFNIIGTEWDTTVDNITFTIHMPKSFDSNVIGFSKGAAGVSGYSGIEYAVDGNTIRGYSTTALKTGHGITMRMELPEEYFEENFDFVALFQTVLPLISVLIGLVIWLIWGRDTKYVAPISFYPPNDYNSAELGMLYKGKAGDKEVVSLLIYLANQGYFTLEEIQTTSLFLTDTSFKIIFKKEAYEGNNYVERTFFEGLYQLAKTDPHTGEKYVTASELSNRFYSVSNQIIKSLNSKENYSAIYEKKPFVAYAILVLMMIALYGFGIIFPCFQYMGDITVSLFVNLFTIIAVVVFVTMFKLKNGNIATNAFAVIWSLGFGGIPFCAFTLPAIIGAGKVSTAITCIAALIILIVIMHFMPKRTPKGVQLLGEIEGFRTFLNTAEKPRLETLVMENPNYFYDILPYTYVLNVSDKWIKQFEGIVYKAPEWYHGAGAFSTAALGSFMTNTMSSARSSMTSSPSSSGGGSGSSGGSSSGGGGGGGGGSSW